MTDNYGRKSSKSWSEIGSMIFGSYFKMMEIEKRKIIRNQVAKWTLLLASAGAMILGTIYLINALAIGINDFFGIGNWPGYFFVGIALLIAGKIMKNKSKDK
jgi:hypothetical protein